MKVKLRGTLFMSHIFLMLAIHLSSQVLGESVEDSSTPEEETSTSSDGEIFTSSTPEDLETTTILASDLDIETTSTTTTVKPVKGRSAKQAKARGRRIMGRAMKEEPIIELDETLGRNHRDHELSKGRSMKSSQSQKNAKQIPTKSNGRAIKVKPRGRRIMGRAMKEEPVVELDETLGAGREGGSHNLRNKGRGMTNRNDKKDASGKKTPNSSKNSIGRDMSKIAFGKKLMEFLKKNYPVIKESYKLLMEEFGGGKSGREMVKLKQAGKKSGFETSKENTVQSDFQFY